MPPDEPRPADPNQGFPNPHAEHFDGERTPAEQAEFERQQEIRRAAGETSDDVPPANPTGIGQAAY